MGSVPCKSQQNYFITQHRKRIFNKWKYQIQNRKTIQCDIIFDDNLIRFNKNRIYSEILVCK
jgi:hypothetical protein